MSLPLAREPRGADRLREDGAVVAVVPALATAAELAAARRSGPLLGGVGRGLGVEAPQAAPVVLPLAVAAPAVVPNPVDRAAVVLALVIGLARVPARAGVHRVDDEGRGLGRVLAGVVWLDRAVGPARGTRVWAPVTTGTDRAGLLEMDGGRRGPFLHCDRGTVVRDDCGGDRNHDGLGVRLDILDGDRRNRVVIWGVTGCWLLGLPKGGETTQSGNHG